MRALRRLLVLLTALIAFTAGTLTPASAAYNDYPWRTDTSNTADSWGFTKRQCVSWVAWRLAQHRKPINNRTQRWGSAMSWDETARRLGYGISRRPVLGAVAHWNPGERAPWYANYSKTPNGTITAGLYGHVGFVQAVYADGSASVSHYNLSGTRSYSVTRVKAPRYLYLR